MSATINWKNIHIENTWVILVPASIHWVTNWMDEHYDGGLDADDKQWLGVYEGVNNYNALISLDNSGPDGAEQLVSRLSPFVSGKIVQLIFEDNGVYQPVTVYMEGRIIEATSVDPFKTATNYLGKDLPNAPVPSIEREMAICVVENVKEEDIKQIINIGFTSYPPFELFNHDTTIIICNKALSVSNLAPVFADELKNKTVYSLFVNKTDKSNFRFICSVFKGEEILGTYYFPSKVDVPYDDDPILTSIKGETEPAKIVAKLNVPEKLFNFN